MLKENKEDKEEWQEDKEELLEKQKHKLKLIHKINKKKLH